MTRKQLIDNIKSKQSFLCVGLDPDIKKIPQHLLDCENPPFEFNRQIIDATAPYAVAYKPNLAFYESLGTEGWIAFETTSELSARTLSRPVHNRRRQARRHRQHIAHVCTKLLRTSGSRCRDRRPIYGRGQRHTVLRLRRKMGGATRTHIQQRITRLPAHRGHRRHAIVRKSHNNLADGHLPESMMYVVGATQGRMFEDIRRLAPDNFLPRTGSRSPGGSLEEVCRYGMTPDCGLLVNRRAE